jgi:hypothetical protein
VKAPGGDVDDGFAEIPTAEEKAPDEHISGDIITEDTSFPRNLVVYDDDLSNTVVDPINSVLVLMKDYL